MKESWAWIKIPSSWRIVHTITRPNLTLYIIYTKYESNHSIFTTTSDCWHNNVQSLLWIIYSLSWTRISGTVMWHTHGVLILCYTTIKLTNLLHFFYKGYMIVYTYWCNNWAHNHTCTGSGLRTIIQTYQHSIIIIS